jgi:hypothetical protein
MLYTWQDINDAARLEEPRFVGDYRYYYPSSHAAHVRQFRASSALGNAKHREYMDDPQRDLKITSNSTVHKEQAALSLL